MERIIKTDESHKTVTFAVLVPDEPDYNGDVIDADEITKTAHNFAMNLWEKVVNVNHEDGTDQPLVKIVESYILPMALDFGDDLLPWGTRMVALKFEDDDMYKDVLSGEYVGVSMEGWRYKD